MLRNIALALAYGGAVTGTAVAVDFYQLHMWKQAITAHDITWAVSAFVHSILGFLAALWIHSRND